MVFKGLLLCACWTAANHKPTYFPTVLRLLSDHTGMTRFSDPVEIEHDFGEYTLAHGSWLWIPESLTSLPLNRGAQVLLACHIWPLHVGVIRYVDSPAP